MSTIDDATLKRYRELAAAATDYRYSGELMGSYLRDEWPALLDAYEAERDANAELTREVERLRAYAKDDARTLDNCRAECAAQYREHEATKRRLDAAQAALRRYGKHEPVCAVTGGYEYGCNCGLDAALARLISGDMAPEERADFAERVRALANAAREYIDAFRAMRDPDANLDAQERRAADALAALAMVIDGKHWLDMRTLPHLATGDDLDALAALHGIDPCPSHGPDTRQRDGRCVRCGVKV